MATTHYEINWVFDGKAEELFDQEGMKTHSVTTATYPAIPAVGDSICWDWIADGKRFTIVARTFIWRSPEKLFVELRLDLPSKAKTSG
jgi:hypothetical protein